MDLLFYLLVFDSFFVPNIMDFPSIFDKFWNQEEIKGHMSHGSPTSKHYFFHLISTLLQ